MSAAITARDLARDLAEVARALPAWRRGDPDEAALQTLAASSRELHGRAYTLWAWAGRTADGTPAWALPVTAAAAVTFAPRGPAHALIRCLEAAVLAGADPDGVRLEEWRGHACLVAPGLDEDVAAAALSESHPGARIDLARLPAGVVLGGGALPQPVPAAGRPGDIASLARELAVHPVRVALTLLAHGQPAVMETYPPELAVSLREWGCVGEPEPAADEEPSLEIADDPCPRRRHARTVLQRLLRMGKVGPGYHTEFSHIYRGAPPHERAMALEVGEALLRAGLLGEKPSVGQRHVYLRREALRDIHALIDRGETRDPELTSAWTAPPPGAVSAARTARSR